MSGDIPMIHGYEERHGHEPLTHETGDVRQVIEQAWRDGYDFGQADAGFDVCDADDAWTKSGTFRDLAQLTAQPSEVERLTAELEHERHEKETVFDANSAMIRHLQTERDALKAKLTSQPVPSGWQQRIAALRKHACPSCDFTDEEWAERRGWTDAINAVLELLQNAVDALPPAPEVKDE